MPKRPKISLMVNNDSAIRFDPARVDAELKEAREVFGLDCVQLVIWDMDVLNVDHARKVTKPLLDKYGLCLTELWCGFGKPVVYGAYSASSLGLVPSAYRHQRMLDYFRAIEYAKALGVNTICTEFGHTPIDPLDENYLGLVVALKQLAEELEKQDAYLLEETGQTPPPILARLINDVGSERIGINLDPANLTNLGNEAAYAVDVLGPRIKAMHAKDAVHPVYPNVRGSTMYPLGAGDVDFPVILQKLKELNYENAIALEYARPIISEASAQRFQLFQPPVDAETRVSEIKYSIAFLNKLLDEIYT